MTLEETRRPARYINTESRGMQLALVLAIGTVAMASFILAARPLIEVGQEWAKLGATAWLIPVALDAAALVSAGAALIRRQRDQRATVELLTLLLATTVSVAIQIIHAHGIEGTWTLETISVAFLLGAAPILTLAASHIALRALTPPRKANRAAVRKRTARTSSGGQAAAPAAPIEKSPQRPQPTRPRAVPSSGDVPPRRVDESEIEYAVRLNQECGLGQRRAAEIAGTTRSKLETRLRQMKSAA